MWRKIKKNVNKTRGGLSERPAHSPALVEAGFGTERFSLCHGEAPDTSSRHGGSGLSLPGCETPAGSLFANVEVKVNTGKADQMPILPDCSFLPIPDPGSSAALAPQTPHPGRPPPEPAAPALLGSALCVCVCARSKSVAFGGMGRSEGIEPFQSWNISVA